MKNFFLIWFFVLGIGCDAVYARLPVPVTSTIEALKKQDRPALRQHFGRYVPFVAGLEEKKFSANDILSPGSYLSRVILEGKSDLPFVSFSVAFRNASEIHYCWEACLADGDAVIVANYQETTFAVQIVCVPASSLDCKIKRFSISEGYDASHVYEKYLP